MRIPYFITLVIGLFCLTGLSGCKQALELSIDVSPDRNALIWEEITLSVSSNLGEDLAEIKWYKNGDIIVECDNKEKCNQVMDVQGEFRFKVKGKMEPPSNNPTYWGNTEDDNKDSDSVTVYADQECQNYARENGVDLIEANYGSCLVRQTKDQNACRDPEYNDCISYESAQTTCPGDWRLPTKNEWLKFDFEIQNLSDFCLKNYARCSKHTEDDVTYKPYNYVIDAGEQTDEVEVGKWTYYSLFLGEMFIPDTDYITRTNMFSVRCVKTVTFD